MNIFPAIDLYDGKVVRLEKGDYNKMTVYSDNPLSIAKDFASKGAKFLHTVDLEGAKDGTTPNLDVVKDLAKNSGLFVEVGGGIRSEEIIKKYLDSGVGRVILGTVAVTNKPFLKEMVEKYGEKIAVGVDIKDSKIAIKGWTETTSDTCTEFFDECEKMGVKTIICTDISKDGMLGGANIKLYEDLSKKFKIDIIASGGVSSIDDVKKLTKLNMYGAILGKALYTNNIDLKDAIKCANGEDL
jgi:phosphoribosylformimino-5-aminoimidazole carboxamide ribotide isomerase